MLRQMEAGYRSDPFHALRKNLESVTEVEWKTRPLNPSVGPNSEFGEQPELSIADLVLHVGGAKYMYANRAFGDGTMKWGGIKGPRTHDKETVLAWLDAGHRQLVEGLTALENDAMLDTERSFPGWPTPLTVRILAGIVMNHDLYHSGEINRQRALIRGSEGWER